MRSPSEDAPADEAFTRDQVAPRLTAAQVDELSGGLHPPHLRDLHGQRHQRRVYPDSIVFKETRVCPEDRADDVFPQNQDCSVKLLEPGYHLGRLDPAREDFDAAFAWFTCSDQVRRDESTDLGFIEKSPGHQELTAMQIAECGEFPGNYGRTTLVKNNEKIEFEVGGAADLIRGLEE